MDAVFRRDVKTFRQWLLDELDVRAAAASKTAAENRQYLLAATLEQSRKVKPVFGKDHLQPNIET
jgi:hypothetical protein